MDKYTIIEDVSKYICNLLRDNMTPEPVLNKDAIGVCSPNEKGDYILGIYLYDLMENEETRRVSRVNVGVNKQKYPPTYLSLYYMITAYSNAKIEQKYLDDQKILGRAIQVLRDNPNINLGNIIDNNNFLISDINIQLLNLNYEEKNKIWNFSGVPYRLSMCFKVYPVELESTRIKNIQRVIDSDFQVKAQSKK